MVDKNRGNNRRNNKKKNLPILSASQSFIKADYFILEAKKTFNFLRNVFI